MITPNGLQYKYSIEELSLLSAREIASFLVTNTKIYKTVYKQWMKLLIQHKDEVINFIYFSKANDQYNTDLFNYIEIPDYLRGLLKK